MRTFPVHAALLATLVAACSSGVDVEPLPEPGPTESPTAPARDTTRMTVQQLANSVPVTAGRNMSWKYLDTEQDLFEYLARTLGSPDFTRVTNEPALPDALYVKFMNDLALNVCRQMREADEVESDETARTLVRFAARDDHEDVDAVYDNLRYLNLRFFGERVEADDTATVAPLKVVFDIAAQEAAANNSDTVALDAWQAVCVAMHRSPAFHIY